MIRGVYKIYNKITGDFYIGSASSARGIEGRWHEERLQLRGNRQKYKNGNATLLQRAWNKYGEDNFEFLIIETCIDNITVKQVHEIEQQYLDKYWDSGKLYNTNHKATGGHGRHSQHTRKLISVANTGKPKSLEHRKNLSKARMGGISWSKGLTKETDIRVMNAAKKASERIQSTNERTGIKNPMHGKKHSEETINKLQIAAIGKHNGEKNGRAKLKQADANEIRIKYMNDKCTITELAQTYKVSTQIIYKIIKNKTYRAE